MSEKETTAGQWRVLDGAIITDEINDYGNFIVCAIERERTKQDDERLALIVRAVNAHDELVGACAEVLEWFDAFDTDHGKAAILRAALEKAKGGAL